MMEYQRVRWLPVFCDRSAAQRAGSMSHGKPAADAISFTICKTTASLPLPRSTSSNDFLFSAARLVVYWPAPIHAVAHCQPILSSRDFRLGYQCKGVLFLARLQPSRQPSFVDNNRDTVLLIVKK